MKKEQYISPLCELFELSAEAAMCVTASKNASINPFDSGDTDYGLFGN